VTAGARALTGCAYGSFRLGLGVGVAVAVAVAVAVHAHVHVHAHGIVNVQRGA